MKTNVSLLLIILCLGSFSCQSINPMEQFLDHMAEYCGGKYKGEVVFPEENPPFGDDQLLVIFEKCDKKDFRMPFYVGEDKSRTWILRLEEDGLLFKHDHRHEDGTPDEITNYGGYAAPGGSAYQQIFPADDFTADLIPAAATNQWAFELNEEEKTLSYILKRDGNMRFKAVFDLSKKVN